MLCRGFSYLFHAEAWPKIETEMFERCSKYETLQHLPGTLGDVTQYNTPRISNLAVSSGELTVQILMST